MTEQQLMVILFVVGWILTAFLAIAGWIVATLIMKAQLESQHDNSIKVDEERLRREMRVKAAGELITRLYQLSEAATKVHGNLSALRMILPGLPKNLIERAIFVKELLPMYNESWRDASDAGLSVFPVFDSFEPVVHAAIPERDELFICVTQLLACQVGVARDFFQTAADWVIESGEQETLSNVVGTLDVCDREFEPVKKALDDCITRMRIRLQNEFLAPIFGHVVDPQRKYTGKSDTTDQPDYHVLSP